MIVFNIMDVPCPTGQAGIWALRIKNKQMKHVIKKFIIQFIILMYFYTLHNMLICKIL